MKRLLFSGLLAFAAASCGGSESDLDKLTAKYCAETKADAEDTAIKGCWGEFWADTVTTAATKKACTDAVAAAALVHANENLEDGAEALTDAKKLTKTQLDAFAATAEVKFDTLANAVDTCDAATQPADGEEYVKAAAEDGDDDEE